MPAGSQLRGQHPRTGHGDRWESWGRARSRLADHARCSRRILTPGVGPGTDARPPRADRSVHPIVALRSSLGLGSCCSLHAVSFPSIWGFGSSSSMPGATCSHVSSMNQRKRKSVYREWEESLTGCTARTRVLTMFESHLPETLAGPHSWPGFHETPGIFIMKSPFVFKWIKLGFSH